MVISYNGLEFFKVQFGSAVLAFNPISKKSKLKQTRFGADIALSSINHPDCNGLDQVGLGDKEPLVIFGPGAYEAQGIFIEGFSSVSNYGGRKSINTIYTINLEGMNICFLGALSNPVLDSKTLEALGDIDVLFVPVGGNDEVLEPSQAYKLAVSLEANIVIPMHYDRESLKSFLDETGQEGLKPVEKLTLKKKDLIGKESEIVVLTS